MLDVAVAIFECSIHIGLVRTRPTNFMKWSSLIRRIRFLSQITRCKCELRQFVGILIRNGSQNPYKSIVSNADLHLQVAKVVDLAKVINFQRQKEVRAENAGSVRTQSNFIENVSFRITKFNVNLVILFCCLRLIKPLLLIKVIYRPCWVFLFYFVYIETNIWS